MRLLLGFAAARLATAPSKLDIAALDAPLIAAFLDHLEHDRQNTVATRNNRLAAIHSLFAFLALQHPEHAAGIGRVLAIPPKRTTPAPVTYLSDAEVDALLAAPRRGRTPTRRPPRHGSWQLPVASGQAHHDARAAPHRRDAPPAGRHDIAVIALWLGHEQITTTQIYLHADLTHKQQAIDRARPIDIKPGRYQPPDALLAFLEAL